MDFVTGLPILTNWKRDSYNSIFVIINQLTKMVYYEPIKVIIDVSGLAEVIINLVVKYHSLPNSIVTKRWLFFNLKFWSLLCYFLDIK